MAAAAPDQTALLNNWQNLKYIKILYYKATYDTNSRFHLESEARTPKAKPNMIFQSRLL